MTRDERLRLENLAASVQNLIVLRLPDVGESAVATAAMYHYLGNAVESGFEQSLTVEGCLISVLREVLRDEKSLSLRFGDYIAKFGQTQISAEVRK